MGIRFLCPNGHKLNVKTFLAGKRAICPECGTKVIVPNDTELPEPTVGSEAAESTWAQLDIDSAPPQVSISNPPLAAPVLSASIAAVTEPVAAVAPPGVIPPALPVDFGVLPESIIAAPSPQVIVAQETAALSPEELQQIRRDRNRRNQILVTIFLFMLVIALAGVLIWVLKREVNPPATEPAPVPTTPPAPSSITRPTTSIFVAASFRPLNYSKG